MKVLEKLHEKQNQSILLQISKFINEDIDDFIPLSKEEKSTIVQDFVSRIVKDFVHINKINYTDDRNIYKELIITFESLITKCVFEM